MKYNEKNLKIGRIFEDYVRSLMSHEIEYLHRNSDDYDPVSGKFPLENCEPDMYFRVADVEFAIECKYRSQVSSNGKVKLISSYTQLQNYKDYDSFKRQVFIVLGVGGKPSNPDSIYIIPLHYVERLSYSIEELKLFKRDSSSTVMWFDSYRFLH